MLVVIGVAMSIAADAAWAQQKVIELTYGTPYGPDQPFSVVDKKWIAKVEKESGGRLKIKPYWSGSIIHGHAGHEELAEGVVDIARISPASGKSGYPITKSSFLLFSGVHDTKTSRRVFKDLLNRFPEIEKEYKGVKPLCWSSGMSCQLITQKPVRKLDDLKGMRIRANGALGNVIGDLGAESMSMNAADLYVALQKKLVDGVFVPYEAFGSLHFADVAKYVTVINLYIPHAGTRAMNLNSYNKLPPDIRKIIDDNIEYWGAETDKEMGEADRRGLEAAKKAKVEIINMPGAELDKFYGVVKNDAVRVARELDAKGLPGTKILEEHERLTGKYSKSR